ncbi:glycosyltransferase family 4 protein [Cellulomonas xiejunii]|uniref:glycosyltransferase family 4 protein n=1 Tax=Cellulomonas xiejunii TaxID=2968083 RepID=UPI001D0DEBB2|nr:glycosyltransferase family 4 protein [Cellulomonas xiejunii]MCC2312913.1 glycosyltransferase family 4 protein [Cellulomonas xiejunii]
MRIGLVKPDWGIRGGFEVVVDRVVRDLSAAGHDVDVVQVAVAELGRTPFGASVDPLVWAQAPEWFTHMALVERFRALDLSDYDVVVSTQPPSYAVRHPRHLALFYHHQRAFYDLEDVWVAAGRADAALHRAASALLRHAEADDIAGVGHFLVGSRRVQERLGEFHGPGLSTSLYEAAAPVVDAEAGGGSHVLTVSRHEFTKRTELTVQALALGDVPGVLVGDGGRLPYVRDLAARFATGALDPVAVAPQDLWLNLGLPAGDEDPAPAPHVRLLGRVDDATLDGLYRDALCVVAPAYDEDDGLTVREAMAYGRPVVVCRDGGGLTAFVEHGVNGLVVEPDGAAIAAAVAELAGDPDLAARLGRAGQEKARTLTEARARRQLLDAVERTAELSR